MPRLRLSGRKPGRTRAGVALLAVGLPMTAFLAAAPAQTTAAYFAVAAADGMRVSASAPGFLVVEDFVDAGGPTAQAAISDLEGSRGFASVPYPGDLVLSGPGLLSIAAGIQLPAGYPWYAASAHPTTPEAVVEQPGLHMESHSTDSSSDATARAGSGSEEGGTAHSTAKVVRETSGMTAEAAGVVDVVKVGPVQVKGFVATAKVTRAPGGEPQRSSSMQFGSMTIGDTAIGVRDGVLVIGETTVPMDGFAPVQKALDEAGVTVELVKATDTEDGVLAPGLLITRKQPFEAGGTTFVVRYALGRALAAAKIDASTSAPGLDLGGVEPEIPVPSSDISSAPGPEPATAAGVSTSLLPDTTSVPAAGGGLDLSSSAGYGLPSGSDVSSGSGYGLPGDTAAAAPVTPVPAPSGVAAPFSAAVATEPIAPLSSWSFFPMMLLAGVVVAVAALGRRLIRS